MPNHGQKVEGTGAGAKSDIFATIPSAMKNLLFLPIAALPLLLTGCETEVVTRHPSRTVVVERDYRRGPDPRYTTADRYDRRTVAVVDARGDRDYDDRRVYRPDDHRGSVVIDPGSARRETVVVNPRVSRSQVEVRYQTDSRGRYYIKDGRRVYVNAGVYY